MQKKTVKEEQRNKYYMTQSSYINDHIKCEWTRQAHSKGKDCHTEYKSKQAESKRMKKDVPANRNHERIFQT